MAVQLFYQLVLRSRRQIASAIWEFRFNKPADFKHTAGQFTQFYIPEGSGFVLRSYSISSASAADYLEFCIKLIPSGIASNYLSKLEVGQKLNASVSRGLFVCQDISVPRYFIATGTGIAPIMAMIDDNSNGGEMDLLFGVRNEEDLFWVERFEAVKAKNKKFNFLITLSQGSKDWTGQRGRVTEHLKIDPKGHYYICGRMEMVKDVRNFLLNNGVNIKSVHFEIF